MKIKLYFGNMIPLLWALLLCICQPAFSESWLKTDPWRTEDWTRQTVYFGLQAIDYLQTRHIAKNENFGETNPILGRNPDMDEVVRYNLAMFVGNTLVTHLLPARYRKNWQYLTIGVELQAVVHNKQIGVKLEF